eukprot:3406818-Amphidinium_carterae.1
MPTVGARMLKEKRPLRQKVPAGALRLRQLFNQELASRDAVPYSESCLVCSNRCENCCSLCLLAFHRDCAQQVWDAVAADTLPRFRAAWLHAAEVHADYIFVHTCLSGLCA